jgi:hypothetical protein
MSSGKIPTNVRDEDCLMNLPCRESSQRNIHFQHPNLISWKGLKWYTLLILSDKEGYGSFDLYVGYKEIPEDERCALHLNVTFQFMLLDDNLEELLMTSKPVQIIFS